MFKLTQDEIEKLNSSIYFKEIEFVIKNLLIKKTQALMVSLESLSNIQEWINLRGGKNSEYLRTMNDSYIAIYSPNYFPQTTRKKQEEKNILYTKLCPLIIWRQKMLKLQVTITKRKITNPSAQSLPLPLTLQGLVVNKD